MQADCLTFHPLYMERIWWRRKLQTYFDRALPPKIPQSDRCEGVRGQKSLQFATTPDTFHVQRVKSQAIGLHISL